MSYNPWRYNTPPGWNNIQDAPRDGTVIEIQNNYGIAPTWSLNKWIDDRGWINAKDEHSGVGDGPWLSWRPYTGSIDSYRDPTDGAQNTQNYWLLVAGMAPVLGGGIQFDEEPKISKKDLKSCHALADEKPIIKKSWLRKLMTLDFS